jgi:hypothetical protein
MNQAQPESRVEIAFSSTVPADVRDEVLAELAARGIEPTENHLAYASVGDDPTIIALSILVAPIVKPTAEALGNEIRDALALAAATLKGRLGLGGTYEVSVEAGDRRVRYSVPANEHEDEAWAAMNEDFSRRPETNGARHWWPGRGWLTDREIASGGRSDSRDK